MISANNFMKFNFSVNPFDELLPVIVLMVDYVDQVFPVCLAPVAAEGILYFLK